MNKRMLKKVSQKENKAMLLAKLIKYSKGCLNKKQLEKIANFKCALKFENGEELNYLLADQNCYVKYTEDAKEFQKDLYEGRTGFKHSWAGEEITNIKLSSIIGDAKFGLHNEVDYSDNGNFIPAQAEYEEPDFCIDDLIVVYQYNHSWSDYNNDCYDNYYDTIIIYNGKKDSYKMDDYVKYILENFNIE